MESQKKEFTLSFQYMDRRHENPRVSGIFSIKAFNDEQAIEIVMAKLQKLKDEPHVDDLMPLRFEEVIRRAPNRSLTGQLPWKFDR